MNKNLPTPEKRNLLLSGGRSHLESLDGDKAEYELLERLLGVNTRQAARIIAEEFVARFGEVSGTVEELTKRLSPPGRAGKWSELEKRMSQICWIDNCEWSTRHLEQPDIPEEESFLLRAMNVIGALPKGVTTDPLKRKPGRKLIMELREISRMILLYAVFAGALCRNLFAQRKSICVACMIFQARHRNTEDKKVCKNTLLIL